MKNDVIKRWLIVSSLCLTGLSFGSSENVEPLLKTRWGQRGLYAKYTPNHRRLGCWSVAFAQILYHHRINPSGKVKYEGDGYRIDETLDYLFNWDHFAKSLKPASPNEVQSEVARYCYYTAIAIQKEFVDGKAYKGNSDLRREGIKKYFLCNMKRYRNDKHSDQVIRDVILEELAAGRPLLLYVEGEKGLGHAFAIDGVRAHKERIAVHLNCGWEGSDDGWYLFDRPFKTSLGIFNNPNRWVLAIRPEKKEASKKVSGNDL